MKKVLIITYYWPPAGGPGVQRVLKFAKYLPEFGWQPIIMTVESGEYPAIDTSLLIEIPPNITVYKTKSFEPFNIYKSLTGQKGNIPTHILSKSENESLVQKLSKWVRANLFIPDARVGWIPTIVKEGLKIIEKEKPDLIFSSSPPHSLQIGAMKLAKRSRLKWVADFRDPWTDGFWQKDINRINYADKKDKSLEAKVLRGADALVTVSNSIANDFTSRYSTKCNVITNGYDSSDFDDVKKLPSNKFRITYAGTISKDQRIDNFLSALRTLNENYPEGIEVNFYGNCHSSILDKIRDNKLDNIVNLHPNVEHEKVIELLCNSNILLLVIPDSKNNEGIVTGKLFEYMATKNFILGIGPVHGDAAKILEETGTGKMFDYNHGLIDVTTEKLIDWKNGKEYKVDHETLTKYSRKSLTAKLAEIFTETV